MFKHRNYWPFADKHSKQIGLSVRGFTLTFPNLATSTLKLLLEPRADLINTVSGFQETSTIITQAFFRTVKTIEDNIKNYKTTSIFQYINEKSYFLSDKNDLIKDTYATALNKKLLIYGSISYFNKKTENKIFKTVSLDQLLRFYVKKDTLKK